MQRIESIDEVASLEQRWVNSWATSLHTRCVFPHPSPLYTQCRPSCGPRGHSDLKPLRIPLHSKKSKRCPACRHILVKPEQKAQSVRYKIKLVAANYLPAITVVLPHLADAARRATAVRGSTPAAAAAAAAAAAGSDDAGDMQAGKTYPFQLALTNPLYDPIQVRLTVQRQIPPAALASSSTAAVASGPQPEKSRRPPFAVSLPSSAFPIAAFAEAWEYDDDEDMFGVDDDEISLEGRGARDKDGRGMSKTVGVLEKRANVTVVGGEVVIGKDAKGEAKVSPFPEPRSPCTRTI
jgi:dynactin 4